MTKIETLPIGTRFTTTDAITYKVIGTSLLGIKAVRWLPAGKKFSRVPKTIQVGTDVYVIE